MVASVRRGLALLSSIIVVVAAVLLVARPPAIAATAVAGNVALNGYESDLAQRVNAARTSGGLATLAVTQGTTDLAREWAAALATAGTLSHNPQLGADAERYGSPSWTVLAENVAFGGSSSSVMNAYMASKPHQTNIMNSKVTAVGVGTAASSDGRVWDTMVFVNSYDASYGAARSTPQDISSAGTVTPVGPTERWWELRDGYDAGRAQHSVYYGGPNATTLSCDINGDQRSDLIAYENGTWYIRTSVDSGPATVFTYGAPGWIPVCGDWDGNGTSGIGVYNPATNTWYLRNIAGPGPADATFSYGFPGTIPVVGDWDGNGTKTIAVYDPSKGNWWMRNTNTPGPPNTITQYGFPGTTPAPGDFNGDRRTDLAVVANGRWYIRTSPGPGNPDRIVDYGLATDQPLTGNWDGTPGDGIGVSRPGRR